MRKATVTSTTAKSAYQKFHHPDMPMKSEKSKQFSPSAPDEQRTTDDIQPTLTAGMMDCP